MTRLIRCATTIAVLIVTLSGCRAAGSDLYWISKGGAAPSLPEFMAWRKDSKLFQAIAAYAIQDLHLSDGGRSESERIGRLAGDFWSIAAVQPYFGRLLHPNDSKTVVLSFALFQRSFAADPAVLGREISINGERFTVVGVLPRTFSFLFPQLLAAGAQEGPVDAYLSATDSQTSMAVVGKLAPGVRPMQAEAELRLLSARAGKDTAAIHVTPLKRSFSGGYKP